MDIIELKRKLKTASSSITIKQLQKHVRRAYLASPKKDSQTGNSRNRWSVIAMEEMAECQQAISKFIRGKGDRLNLTEELADVIISVFMIAEMYNIKFSDINKVINIKIERVKEKQKSGNMFK